MVVARGWAARWRSVIRSAASSCALLTTACFPAYGQSLTSEELSKLKRGDAIVSVDEDPSGEADGRIAAAIDIPAPPHSVWTTMLDCGRALKFVEGLKSCKILQSGPTGAWDIREHHSQWLSILPETVSVFRSDYVTDKEIRFSRVSGNLRFLKGNWRLEPLSGGTRTRLRYNVRIGISAPVPGFMVRAAIEQDVPKLLMALRGEAAGGRP